MGDSWFGRGRSSREVVAQSWDRARSQLLDPESVIAPLRLDGSALREYRDAHPLAGVLPVIRRLLIDDVEDDSGLLVAVGDAAGRLLWIEGDRRLKSRAESMLFVEGSDWSEAAVGTSAPGTALTLDRGVQIDREEHFALRVQRWSCTAVPVHDLETGRILGVVDITGGEDAAAPTTLALVEASVAAAERELLITRLRAAQSRPRRASKPVARTPAQLDIMGRDTGLLRVGGQEIELSARHAQILAVLAWHPSGLGADQLAELVYGRADAAVTLRAEMVRLRRQLQHVAEELVPLARPYRLGTRLGLDARALLGLLQRGAHRAALASWAPPLPGSDSPGIDAIRRELEVNLRESVLECASADTLYDYARTEAGQNDGEVWATLLRLLPARSPRRASVVARLDEIERDAG